MKEVFYRPPKLEGVVLGRIKPDVPLNSDQEAEAQRIYERLRDAFDDELKRMARLLASKANNQLFGQTEFELRDRLHELGAQRINGGACDESSR